MEGDAKAEAVGARPGDAERAQAGLVIDLQGIEVGVDGLGALKVQLHRERAIFEALA